METDVILYALYRLVTEGDGAVRRVLEIAMPSREVRRKLIKGLLRERELLAIIERIEQAATMYAYSHLAEQQGTRTIVEISAKEARELTGSTWARYCVVYGKALQALITYWINGRAGRNLLVGAEAEYQIKRGDDIFKAYMDIGVSHKKVPDHLAALEVKASLRKSAVAEVALDHPEGTYLICTSKNIREAMIRRAVAEGMVVVVVGGYDHPDVISLEEMMDELKELFAEALKELKTATT